MQSNLIEKMLKLILLPCWKLMTLTNRLLIWYFSKTKMENRHLQSWHCNNNACIWFSINVVCWVFLARCWKWSIYFVFEIKVTCWSSIFLGVLLFSWRKTDGKWYATSARNWNSCVNLGYQYILYAADLSDNLCN